MLNFDNDHYYVGKNTSRIGGELFVPNMDNSFDSITEDVQQMIFEFSSPDAKGLNTTFSNIHEQELMEFYKQSKNNLKKHWVNY